ncbi:hypothetical protein KEJ24_08055 [Candidatus Bathyarchaeota archaeon]|nr:hypothetical protein [Candidatus Bathyarchaeota archaeon]
MTGNEQIEDILLKMAMLHRLKVCFLNVLAKRRRLEAELMEIKKISEKVCRERAKELTGREEYLNVKIHSFKNQERRLYQKLKWMEEQLKTS